jgi:hypothetical protein
MYHGRLQTEKTNLVHKQRVRAVACWMYILIVKGYILHINIESSPLSAEVDSIDA